jgi:Tfp pilus tip-associated adhesin PilY1
MDTIFNKLSSSGKRYLAKATMFSLAGGAVLAAAIFFANNQPWGYISPPALSGTNFKHGNVVAFTPWFEQGSFRGDLLASPVDTDGNVALLATNWRASPLLDVQDYLTGRNIVTTDGLGAGIPFRFADLTAAQQLQVESEDILNYVRGDRSNESDSDMRIRTGVLGDIVHSGPVYVGKPLAGYNYGNYLAFANTNAGRAARVYVGANDGMLHAFDASDGSEVFAPPWSWAICPNWRHNPIITSILSMASSQLRMRKSVGAGTVCWSADSVPAAKAITAWM